MSEAERHIYKSGETMSDLTLDERIARLPAWARDYIRDLKRQAEPNNMEVRASRLKAENDAKMAQRFKEKCDMMEHLMTCAAKGGHETAAAYVEWAANEYLSPPVDAEPVVDLDADRRCPNCGYTQSLQSIMEARP